MSDGEDSFLVSFNGAAATLWLNRPEKQNAMTFEMWQQLPAVLDKILESEPKVLFVRGTGAHFCAGADIATIGKGLGDAGVPHGYRATNEQAEEALAAYPRPTVAVIEGNCIGGGCQIAIACDLRLATPSARFGITPAKLGITYPANSILRTVALLGPSATKRLLFSAEFVEADEAFRLGLSDYLVEPDELENTLEQLAETIGSRSLLSQLGAKAIINASSHGEQALRDVIDYWEHAARSSSDLSEGLAAFSERRQPTFEWKPEN